MSDLKPCPFCGGEAELCYSEVDTFCRKCNVMQETELWNTRPIEDALRLRIAELEAENGRLRCGIIDKTEPEKFDENIAALTKAMSERFKDEDPEEFFRNMRG